MSIIIGAMGELVNLTCLKIITPYGACSFIGVIL